MDSIQANQLFPEIAIADGRLGASPPAVADPVVVPALAKAVHQIGAVAVELDAARPAEGTQRLERGAKLHPLVRGVSLAARDFSLVVAVAEHRGPSAGAGVPRACPVGIDRHFRLRPHAGVRIRKSWSLLGLASSRRAGESQYGHAEVRKTCRNGFSILLEPGDQRREHREIALPLLERHGGQPGLESFSSSARARLFPPEAVARRLRIAHR